MRLAVGSVSRSSGGMTAFRIVALPLDSARSTPRENDRPTVDFKQVRRVDYITGCIHMGFIVTL